MVSLGQIHHNDRDCAILDERFAHDIISLIGPD